MTLTAEQKAQRRARYAANPDKQRADARAYYAANREVANAANKARYRANHEQRLVDNRSYYAAKFGTPEQREARQAAIKARRAAGNEDERAKARARYAANAKVREQKFAAVVNRRARKDVVFVEYVDPLVVFERDGGICQICNQPIGDAKWHIDHVIPLARHGEHSYANTQLSHAGCNLSKGTKLPDVAA